MDYQLRKLSIDDGIDIFKMLQRIPKDENGYINNINGLSFEDYKGWLLKSESNSQKIEIEDGWKVPGTVYWLYVNGSPVGMGKIRHLLTEQLMREGGTIGYAIVPEERGKGYGKILLGELLKEAHSMGIDRALITVRNSNTASIKVAVAHGGMIERISEERHYIWIDCTQT